MPKIKVNGDYFIKQYQIGDNKVFGITGGKISSKSNSKDSSNVTKDTNNNSNDTKNNSNDNINGISKENSNNSNDISKRLLYHIKLDGTDENIVWQGNEQYEYTNEFGNVVKFDGKSCIKVNYDKKLDAKFTIVFYIKHKISYGGKHSYFVINNKDDGKNSIQIWQCDNDIIFRIVGSYNSLTDINVNNGFWHQIAINSNGELYIDTIKTNYKFDVKIDYTKLNSFVIGADVDANNQINDYALNGTYMSNFRVYNDILSDLDLKELYKIDFKEPIIQCYVGKFAEKNFKNIDYSVGKGDIKFIFKQKYKKIRLILGGFNSIDDNGTYADHITLKTKKGEIKIILNGRANLKNPKVIDGNDLYKINLKTINIYKDNLSGQNDAYNTSKTFFLEIDDYDNDELIVNLFTNENYSNEAYGYGINSIFLSDFNSVNCPLKSYQFFNMDICAGKGDIPLGTINNDLYFVVGTFASVDGDDYFYIKTNKGNIKLSYNNFNRSFKTIKVIENETDYKVLTIPIYFFDKGQVLDGQEKSFSTTLFLIAIKNIKNDSITLNFNTNQNFSDEIWGLKSNSILINKIDNFTGPTIKDDTNIDINKINIDLNYDDVNCSQFFHILIGSNVELKD